MIEIAACPSAAKIASIHKMLNKTVHIVGLSEMEETAISEDPFTDTKKKNTFNSFTPLFILQVDCNTVNNK